MKTRVYLTKDGRYYPQYEEDGKWLTVKSYNFPISFSSLELAKEYIEVILNNAGVVWESK